MDHNADLIKQNRRGGTRILRWIIVIARRDKMRK